MSDVSNLADHASQMDDRWLAMALLIIGLVASFLLWKWMVKDREATATRLTEVTDRHITVTEKLSEVVATNTAVLNEVRKKL